MSIERVKGKVSFLHYPTARDKEDLLYATSMFVAALPWLLVIL